MNLPRRVKRAWSELTGESQRPVYSVKRGTMRPEEMQRLGEVTGAVVVEVGEIGDITVLNKAPEALGDGQAAFLGAGTHDEFVDQQREDKGLKKWYDTILGKGTEV